MSKALFIFLLNSRECVQTKPIMAIENVRAMIKFLPKYNEIEILQKNEAEVAYILKKANENLESLQNKNAQADDTESEEAFYLVESLTDKMWQRIHTGHFSEVPLETRKIYAIANYYKIFYFLLRDCSSTTQIENCSAFLDNAMLVGCTQGLFRRHDELRCALIEFFDKALEKGTRDDMLPVFEKQSRITTKSDILTIDCPSVFEFSKSCFEKQTPALLLNTFAHWPALVKWRDLNYINRIAGNRCVPIEIGSNYTTDEWSQQIVKIRDFLWRQFGGVSNSNEIEYLAQHELFEQIPALKADIRVPDYCILGQHTSAVDIKAWLGPKGTISPMHFDPKHNLLCQVFGTKYIILAAPADTEYLYPHESEFLNNTSQIDAANIDLEKFPLTNKAKFYNLILQEDDCLYIPPKWWHYVRADSPSFSVSFWWD